MSPGAPGYSGRPQAVKLGLRPGQRVHLHHPPAGWDFADPPDGLLDAPDQAQPGPVVVDGGDLDIDQSQRQRFGADDGIGDVAAPRLDRAAGPPWPRDPQRAGRVNAPRQAVEFPGDHGPRRKERDDQVGRAVRARVNQAVRRVGEVPARRGMVQVDSLSGPQAQFGGLGPARVAGGARGHEPD